MTAKTNITIDNLPVACDYQEDDFEICEVCGEPMPGDCECRNEYRREHDSYRAER